MRHNQPSYHISITRDVTDQAWVRVKLRKAWWTSERGGNGRTILETWFDATGLDERAVVSGALDDARAALLDELA